MTDFSQVLQGFLLALGIQGPAEIAEQDREAQFVRQPCRAVFPAAVDFDLGRQIVLELERVQPHALRGGDANGHVVA